MNRMHRLFLLAMSLGIMLVVVGNVASSDHQAKDEEASARRWLRSIDAGEYEEAWENSAGYFKRAVGKETFVRSLEGVRVPLGRVVNRSLISATYATTLPGAPDGEYMVIQFKTEFEGKRFSIETITPMKERDGRWRVSGYYIK